MREIQERGESVWISSEPRVWFDAPIERLLSKTLFAKSSAARSTIYAGYRNLKIYGPRAIYVAIGASYLPSGEDNLILEVGIPEATEKIAPDEQLNHEIAELILTEATNILAPEPILNAGTLRFDQMKIHPIDYTLKAWVYAVRVLIGLLTIKDYELLSDEDIVAKLIGFAGVSPSSGTSLLSGNRMSSGTE